MNQFIISILLLGWTLSLTQAASCNDANQCMMIDMASAAQSGDMKQMCSKQQEIVDCITSAMADCKAKGITLPDAMRPMIENAYSEMKSQHQEMCGGSGASGGSGGSSSGGSMSGGSSSSGSMSRGSDAGEGLSCFDFAKCQVDGDVASASTEEKCRMVKPSLECMRKVIQACNKSDMMTGTQLDVLKDQLSAAEGVYNEHCGACAIVQTMTMLSLFALIALFFNRPHQ